MVFQHAWECSSTTEQQVIKIQERNRRERGAEKMDNVLTEENKLIKQMSDWLEEPRRIKPSSCVSWCFTSWWRNAGEWKLSPATDTHADTHLRTELRRWGESTRCRRMWRSRFSAGASSAHYFCSASASELHTMTWSVMNSAAELRRAPSRSCSAPCWSPRSLSSY